MHLTDNPLEPHEGGSVSWLHAHPSHHETARACFAFELGPNSPTQGKSLPIKPSVDPDLGLDADLSQSGQLARQHVMAQHPPCLCETAKPQNHTASESMIGRATTLQERFGYGFQRSSSEAILLMRIFSTVSSKPRRSHASCRNCAAETLVAPAGPPVPSSCMVYRCNPAAF